MLTVLEALNSAAQYLEKKQIKSARLNAELLLSHILQKKRIELYLSFDRPLQNNETEKFREFLKRRGSFEPLQYITGNVEFFGVELEVNRSVLIPRPETELLVEEIIKAVNKLEAIKILDIGCGSGNISIALAKNLANAKIISLDLSDDAIQTAKKNARLNNIENQITFIKTDILNEREMRESNFDLIVSNPPYVSAEDYKNLDPELRLYEPKLALTDNEDGLSFYRKIICLAKSLLNFGGKLFFEIGAGQAFQVKNIFIKNNFKNITIKQDYSGLDRIIFGENK